MEYCDYPCQDTENPLDNLGNIIVEGIRENLDSWWLKFRHTVDDLLMHSNLHSCERGQNKNGTRHKGKPSASCKDNKWGRCKAQFPKPIFLKSIIDQGYL